MYYYAIYIQEAHFRKESRYSVVCLNRRSVSCLVPAELMFLHETVLELLYLFLCPRALSEASADSVTMIFYVDCLDVSLISVILKGKVIWFGTEQKLKYVDSNIPPLPPCTCPHTPHPTTPIISLFSKDL